MKKIIAVFDGLKFSQKTAHCSLHVCKQTNSHLVGVFLEDKTRISYSLKDFLKIKGSHINAIKQLENTDDKIRSDSVIKYQDLCTHEKINYTIHHDKHIANDELRHESKFTDLMIVDGCESFNIYEKRKPSFLIRDLITEVSCPLLIIGKEYLPYKKILFLYDGGTSCMYALKLFGYILPFLNNLKMEILSVNPPNGSLHLHDNKLFKEFMKRHYPKADYNVLKGLPEIEIPGHLKKEYADTLVILGAKKRNSISKLFWQSMTDNLLRETNLSLFVVSF